MRRILVPLDGSELSASILPDACRAAGPDGEILLIRDDAALTVNPETGRNARRPSREADNWLEEKAESLRREGFRVEVKLMSMPNAAACIDRAAEEFDVDMIACATHGRGPLGRLAHGAVAWHALAHSSVPVLMRHGLTQPPTSPEPKRRHILVPLDGSTFAETALPLAAELAREWQASMTLVRVIPDSPARSRPYAWYELPPEYAQVEREDAAAYLQGIEQQLELPVETKLLTGPTVPDALIHATSAWNITDIVMASHGRTGLSRVILGSVTDALVQRLHCPIIVVPSLVTPQPRLEEVPSTAISR